jgi:hypothetical protein
VPSLATPGGNLTGVSLYATELNQKRLEILQKQFPAFITSATSGTQITPPDIGWRWPDRAETARFYQSCLTVSRTVCE